MSRPKPAVRELVHRIKDLDNPIWNIWRIPFAKLKRSSAEPPAVALKSLAQMVAAPRRRLLGSIAKKQHELIDAMRNVGNVPPEAGRIPVGPARLLPKSETRGMGHTKLDPLSKRELLRLLRMEMTYVGLAGLMAIDPIKVLGVLSSSTNQTSPIGELRSPDQESHLLDRLRRIRQQVIETGLQPLTGLSRLKRLWLSGTQLAEPDDLQIQELTNIENLRLGDIQISEAELQHLTEMDGLEVLILNNLGLTDAGLHHLEKLVDLNTLDLSNNPGITDNGIACLAGLTNLQVLSLEEAQIGDLGLRHLVHLEQLKCLYLDETGITDRGLDTLLALTQLETLSLSHTQITDDGLRGLRQLHNLQRLLLTGTHVTDMALPLLADLPHLRSLCLDSTEVTDRGLKSVANFAELEFVSLMDTRTSPEGIADLRRDLPNCEIMIEMDCLSTL